MAKKMENTKKIRGKAVLAALSVLLAAVPTGCTPEEQGEENTDPVQLATPAPTIVETGSTTATIKWAPVEGAFYYSVWYEGDSDPEMSIDTVIVIKGLEPDTEYKVSVSAEPSTRSNYTSSEKSGQLTFRTVAKPRVSTPEIRVGNVSTTGFEVSWSPVDKAGSYSFTLKAESLGGEAQTGGIAQSGPGAADVTFVPDGKTETETADTLLIFGNFEPGSAISLKIKALPDEENAGEYTFSNWAEKIVSLPLPDSLAAPSVTVERANSTRSVLSWDEIKGAEIYRYTLDGTDTLETKSLSATFEALDRNSDHIFSIQAVSADPKVSLDSKWASVSFTAVYDFTPTLKLSNATATDVKVVFTASVTAGEYFTMAILPKANYLKDSGIDSTAIVSRISKDLLDRADTLVAKGTNATRSEALATLLKSKSTRMTFSSNVYHDATYLCCAFGMETDGSITSPLQVLEAKTTSHTGLDEAGANFSTGDFASLGDVQKYGYSTTSARTYDLCNYLGFSIKRTDSGKTVSEVRYKYMTLSNFKSTFGGVDESTASSAIETWFDTEGNGSTLSASNLEKVNSDAGYSNGYIGLTAGSSYVLFTRIKTADGSTMVAARTFRMCKDGFRWASVSTPDGKAYTIKSSLKIASAAYSAATYNTSSASMSLGESDIETKIASASALSAASVSALNNSGSAGLNMASAPASGRTRVFIVKLTSTAGDETVIVNLYHAE